MRKDWTTAWTAASRGVRRQAQDARKRVQAWPAARRRYLHAVVCALALLVGALAAVTVVQTFRALLRAGPAPVAGIAPPPVSSAEGMVPETQAASRRAGETAPLPEPPAGEGTAFSWTEEARLRDAASFLIAHGEIDEAVKLLNRFPATRSLGQAAGAAVWQEMRDAMLADLAAELASVKKTWGELPAETRRAVDRCLPAAGRSEGGALLGIRTERLSMNDLPDVGKALPPAVALVLAVRLEKHLLRDGRCPPAVARLLVQPLAGAQPPAAMLWEKLAVADTPMPEIAAAPAFVRVVVEERVLWPQAQALLRAEQAVAARAQDDDRAWIEASLGAAGPDLKRLPLDASDAAVRAAAWWARLPPDVAALWAWGLVQPLREAGLSTGAGTPAAASVWTAPAAALKAPPGAAQALPLVLRSPRWRGALRRFDYPDALRQVPRLLEDLQARYAIEETRAAAGRLAQAERAVWLSPGFRWNRLARRLNLFMLPEAAAKLTPYAGDPKGIRFEDVPETAVLAAVKALADEETVPAVREEWLRAARVYAACRGL